ncbi:hypothetical protein A2U01_0065493, partial [Trifolium medium]|nr:hypothetical protein [Trifolium medium]
MSTHDLMRGRSRTIQRPTKPCFPNKRHRWTARGIAPSENRELTLGDIHRARGR